MTTFQLQKLRDLPIEGVAERLGLRVSRHKCLCPFHDDHNPSLTFKNNKFRCWSCGESGDTIKLAEKVLGEGFLEACRWLNDGTAFVITSYRHNDITTRERPPFDASRYERFFERPYLSPAARKFLFEERKLDERVVRWCRLTSWRDKQGVNWLQIPYFDREGKLIGVQNRNLRPSKSPLKGETSPFPLGEGRGEAPPRFLFPSGSECSIYNLPVLNRLKEGEDLYITEGCSDCWAMLSAGHKAIAIPSATLLKPKDITQLLTLNSELLTKYHMFPDRDAPGERLFLQLQKLLPNLEHHQLPKDCKDFSDYYLKLKE